MTQNTFAAGYSFYVKEDHRNGFKGEPVRWNIHLSPHNQGLKNLENGELYLSLKVGTTREQAEEFAEQLAKITQEVCFFDHLLIEDKYKMKANM